MKTPEEYYKSLDAIDSPIDKYKEFNFSSFDMIKFTKAYVRDVVLPEMKQSQKEYILSLLPSDEEIDKERCELYPGEGEINDSKFSAFGKGSRWLRNEILNKLSNGETAKING